MPMPMDDGPLLKNDVISVIFKKKRTFTIELAEWLNINNSFINNLVDAKNHLNVARWKLVQYLTTCH